MIEFILNDAPVKVDVPGDTPLLWVLREELKLRGTKFGCGRGICGACTVHMNGAPVRICILPVESVAGTRIETIEHQQKGGTLHAVQDAWIRHNVPQCGYCQSGQIMKAIGILNQKDTWKEDELIETMTGNLCRCGTYNAMKEALLDAAKSMGKLS
jgi:isoquinoline 1-oxidoreductase alpha subunit